MNVIKAMSYDLNIKEGIIHHYISKANSMYSYYTINKKNGGKRTIYHPSPILKTFQYWLVNNLFDDFKVSDYATAYKKGFSIKENATRHLRSNHLLQMDIKDYFETISHEHLLSVINDNKVNIKKINLAESDLSAISKLCLKEGHMTIGSVSSPILSNAIMYKFDLDLVDKLPKDMVYTRYADDITISSLNYIDDSNQVVVEELLSEYGFKVNHSKTRYSSNSNNKTVTGININDGTISIGLKKKREIKSMLYNKLVKDEGDPQVVLGNLYFLKDIEPHYFDKVIIKYSKHKNVIEYLKEEIKDKRASESRQLIQVVNQ